MIGDHIIRRADGGDDSEENVQSLCLMCNADKTILNEDWRKAG
jgi:5-methylcytosine-specific restriction endonuclease McrA